MTDQEIKDLEERIKKVTDRKDNLELILLLEILKSLNKLILKEKDTRGDKKTLPGLKF